MKFFHDGSFWSPLDIFRDTEPGLACLSSSYAFVATYAILGTYTPGNSLDINHYNFYLPLAARLLL